MVDRKGFYQAHRKQWDCAELHQKPNAFMVWHWLISEAQIRDRIGLKRGEAWASVRHISEHTGISKSTVQRIIASFEKAGMVIRGVGQKRDTLTVCNYTTYQPDISESGTVVGQERDSSGTVVGQERDSSGTVVGQEWDKKQERNNVITEERKNGSARTFEVDQIDLSSWPDGIEDEEKLDSRTPTLEALRTYERMYREKHGPCISCTAIELTLAGLVSAGHLPSTIIKIINQCTKIGAKTIKAEYCEDLPRTNKPSSYLDSLR